jgi:two-component sensor histidine kinase
MLRVAPPNDKKSPYDGGCPRNNGQALAGWRAVAAAWSGPLLIAALLIVGFGFINSLIPGSAHTPARLGLALELDWLVCIGLAVGMAWAMNSLRRDITRRQAVEESLRRSEDSLRQSLDQQRDLASREQMLLRELDHRVRNNLAGLLGLLSLYERTGRSGPEIALAIRGKVAAMKDVHDVISRARGSPVNIPRLLSTLIAELPPGARGGAVTTRGPDLRVSAAQASALAMIVQELFTNSAKYGALSIPGGTIRVEWNGDARHLNLNWRECGGPPVSPPRNVGVGLALVEGLAASELQGGCEFSFEPSGFTCALRAALSTPADPAVNGHAGHSPDKGSTHEHSRTRPDRHPGATT